jgi:hypothetical protein
MHIHQEQVHSGEGNEREVIDHQCNCVITILYYIHIIFVGIIKVIKDETFIGRCNRRQ